MDHAHRAELINRLFSILTARLEDGAGIAVLGQARDEAPSQRERAAQLIEIGQQIAAIGEAIVVMTD
jgi:hypothetical protein